MHARTAKASLGIFSQASNGPQAVQGVYLQIKKLILNKACALLIKMKCSPQWYILNIVSWMYIVYRGGNGILELSSYKMVIRKMRL